VLRQHCQLALAARRNDFVDAVFGEDVSLSCDDVDAKRHGLPPEPEPGPDKT